MTARSSFSDRNLKILALAEHGLSAAEIGRRHGMSGRRVNQILVKFVGFRGARYQRRSPEFVAEARRLWEEGSLSVRLVGKEMGVTKGVIIGVAHRNDFPAKPSPLKG